MQYATAADGCRLAWRRDGNRAGLPLLFCNSIGTDHTLWDAQVAALEDLFDILRFDTRGHGRSDVPYGDYGMVTLAGDAMLVLEVAGLRKANVCGISLGGVIAMRLALDQPGRVHRLVLADTAARIGSADSWEQRREKVLSGGMAFIADASMERFFSPGFRERDQEVVTRFRGGLLASSPVGYAGCCAALRDADMTAEVVRIDAPTLVIAGLQDVSVRRQGKPIRRRHQEPSHSA